MSRPYLAIAAALILLVAWLVIFAPGSSLPSGSKAPAIAKRPHTTFRNSSDLSNGQDRPATIAEKISRPLAADTSPAKEVTDSPKPGDPPTPDGMRSATEFRQALRRAGEEYNEATGNVSVLHPAIWMDPTEDPSLPEAHQGGIRQIAEEFENKVADSGFDPGSPEYRRVWNDAVRESNWKFRARYGARAWSRQHVRAYHLANSGAENP